MQKIITAIDIGTFKVVCCIFSIIDNENLKLEGLGIHKSKGVERGSIIDLEDVENAVSNAINKAEKHSGLTIKEAYVCMSNLHSKSKWVNQEIKIKGKKVTKNDIYNCQLKVKNSISDKNNSLLHLIPYDYILDDSVRTQNPVSLYASLLKGEFHLIECATTTFSNIHECLSLNKVDTLGIVMESFSVGNSAVNNGDKEVGVLVVDIGEGNTSYSIFYENALLFTNSLELAGVDIVYAIMKKFGVNKNDAESIKINYGRCAISDAFEAEIIDFEEGEDQYFNASNNKKISQIELTNVICSVINEIFTKIKQDSGELYKVVNRIILSGGTSNLGNIEMYVSEITKKSCKIGSVSSGEKIKNFEKVLENPEFNSVLGVGIWCLRNPEQIKEFSPTPEKYDGGFLLRFSNWLKDEIKNNNN